MMKEFNLNGKTAIVTGALGLIGRHHCRALAEAGAHVVVCDIDVEAARDFAATLPVRAIGCAADITDRKDLENLLERALSFTGNPDILVNNAAINDKFETPALAAEQSRFENYPLELWQKSLDVNLTGMFLCCQVLGSAMAEAGSGSIINVASTYGVVAPDQSLYRDEAGRQTFYKSPSYPATKAGVIGFTKFLAAYWGHRGVRVNALSPGGVEAGQDPVFIKNYSQKTPLGRMAGADDYRGALVFLASDASRYMTGANLIVDGGWTAW